MISLYVSYAVPKIDVIDKVIFPMSDFHYQQPITINDLHTIKKNIVLHINLPQVTEEDITILSWNEIYDDSTSVEV